MTGTKTAPNALDDLRTSSPLVNQEQLESLTTLLNNEQYALLATELTNLLKYDPLNESLLLLEGELIALISLCQNQLTRLGHYCKVKLT